MVFSYSGVIEKINENRLRPEAVFNYSFLDYCDFVPTMEQVVGRSPSRLAVKIDNDHRKAYKLMQDIFVRYFVFIKKYNFDDVKCKNFSDIPRAIKQGIATGNYKDKKSMLLDLEDKILDKFNRVPKSVAYILDFPWDRKQISTCAILLSAIKLMSTFYVFAIDKHKRSFLISSIEKETVYTCEELENMFIQMETICEDELAEDRKIEEWYITFANKNKEF